MPQASLEMLVLLVFLRTRRRFIRSSIDMLSRKSKLSRQALTKKSSYIKKQGMSSKSPSRLNFILANAVLFVAVGLLAFLGTFDGGNPNGSKPVSALSSDKKDEASNPVDKISSADIAVHVARVVQLEESNSVTNHADTAKAQVALGAVDDSVVAKPQIMAAGLKSKKDIKRYTVQKGDTVPKIAQKFNITSQTVRLSNNLEGDAVTPGQKLWISPINGIVYKVKPGDTPASVASEFRASKDELIAFNDAELTNSFKVGEMIVIPDGLNPISPEYNYYSSGNPIGFAFGSSPDYGGPNGYDYGWCTWHAANRRMDIGRPIPNNMGNAISWLSVARAMGLETGELPREGAVVYHLDIGGWGHVAFVERVNPDGSIRVSDMNYPIWGQETYRTVEPSEFGNYRFIY
jgi:N-acetylmuramoyl-L-alanine amidase